MTLLSCASSNKNKVAPTSSEARFFRQDVVYSETLPDKTVVHYFFNSENGSVYLLQTSKKLNDSIEKSTKDSFAAAYYGKYIIDGGIIKIQKDIEKTVGVKPKRVFSIMFMFVPVRPSQSSNSVTIVENKLITEGDIKQDRITWTKSYMGTKKLNFSKKKSAKINELNTNLVYNPKLIGKVVKDNELSNYSMVISKK